MIDYAQARAALSGPVFSLNTPFARDGEIDEGAVRRLIDFALANGEQAIILTQGDSLYTVLTDDEVGRLTRLAVEHTAGRAMVVAADRSWWTGREVAFARYCREVGADVLMVLPPDWARSGTVESFVAHYSAVAAEIPVMVVTNVFEPRPIAFAVEVLERLREVGGVVAVKDDLCGELGRRSAAIARGRWAFFASGHKRMVLDVAPYGLDGYMSTFLVIVPEIAKRFWRAVAVGDAATIRRIVEECDVPIWDMMLAHRGGFDAVIHGILELKGLAPRWRRPPYHSLDDAEMERLAAFLKQHHWL